MCIYVVYIRGAYILGGLYMGLACVQGGGEGCIHGLQGRKNTGIFSSFGAISVHF